MARIADRSIARPSASGARVGSRSPPENLDPYVALWSMCNALRRDRLQDQRVVVRLDFTGFRPHERYWLLLEHREAEICKTYLGLDEDLYITADAEAFVKWHAGQLSWAEATRDSRIQLHGPSWLVRAFPSWNGRSMFAHIRPDAGITRAVARSTRSSTTSPTTPTSTSSATWSPPSSATRGLVGITGIEGA
jgi:hypothetical protein